MKRPFFSFLLGMIVLLLLLGQAIGAKDEKDAAYPLSKGTYWTYRGTASWTTEGTEVVEKVSTARMEVVDVIERNHLVVAVMKGDPSDYKSEGTADVSEHLLIRVGATTYFDVGGERVPTILNKVKDPKASLFGLLRKNEEPMLDLPLVLGKTYGDPVQMTRQDQYYCWVVTKEEEVDLSSIKGLERQGKRKQYTLRYFTLPGEVFYDFVPGVGITGYRYKHHGTIDEADMKLIEFGKVSSGTGNKTANK